MTLLIVAIVAAAASTAWAVLVLFAQLMEPTGQRLTVYWLSVAAAYAVAGALAWAWYQGV